jgi:glycosyltransferase involved in cell wall biosynthesis
MTAPLVTLGMPVRNGAATLRVALDSMVAQDYPNLEIVISDNASDDQTLEILAEYEARFANIRIIRQSKPLTATGNFLFVLGEAKGEFFAWCAHDDTRSSDFVSALVAGFRDDTVLSFGDWYIWDGKERAVLQSHYDFQTEGLSVNRRLMKAAYMQCAHFYGVWRTVSLKRIRYRVTLWWPDMPFMLGAATLGTFRYIPGPAFYYFEMIKADDIRERYHNDRQAPPKWYNLFDLLRGSYCTVHRTKDVLHALLAVVFLADKHSRGLIGLARRFRRRA